MPKLLKSSTCLKRVWMKRQKRSKDSKKCNLSQLAPTKKEVLSRSKLEVLIKLTRGGTTYHKLEI